MTEEDRIQKAIVEYIRAVLPDAICFAVPNGGGRSRATAGILKATGVLAGVSDLVILFPFQMFGANRLVLFAEVKTATGDVKKHQRHFGELVQSFGHKWAVWRSIDDVRLTFQHLGIRTKEST